MEPHTWAREPVYGQLWHELKEGRAECAEEDFLDIPFSEDELELSMAVCNAFGKYSGPELSKLIRKEASWVNVMTRTGATENEVRNEPITLESMKGYFTTLI